MHCPTLSELPAPPPGKTGWPWTEESPHIPEVTQEGTPWPKVSIVIPSYNQGRFLEESIRSVLLQGYPDLELIVIDGGSTDESVEMIKKYERWLTYWVSEPDRGQSHAINKGLERSTGKWFNWHNADDLLTQQSLATMAAAFLKYADVSGVYGYPIVFDHQTNRQFHSHTGMEGKEGFVLGVEQFVVDLKTYCQQGGLMDRELLIEAGMVDEDLHYVMDLDLCLRLALLRLPAYFDYPVVLYRDHPQAKTSAMEEKALERVMVARKLFRRPGLSPQIAALKHQAFATAHHFALDCYMAAENYESALWHLLCEMRHVPSGKWSKRRRIAVKLLNGILRTTVKRVKRLTNNVSHWKYFLLKLKTTRKYSTYLDQQFKKSQWRYNHPETTELTRKQELVKLAADYVNLKSVQKALVIGCRDPLELDFLEVEGVQDVEGIDLFSCDPRIKVMDMHKLTYPENTFDLIYTSHSLEHAFDYKKVIAEMQRVSKNNAIIVVEVPVKYQTNDVDRHDFKHAENLITIFSHYLHLKEVLYKADIDKEHNWSGDDVARVMLRIGK